MESIVEKLNHRLYILRNISRLFPLRATKIAAEGLVASVIRYCLPLYGTVRLTESDPVRSDMHKLHVAHNEMIRTIYSKRKKDKVNMKTLRKEHNIQSINQMTCQAIATELRKAFHYDTLPKASDSIQKICHQNVNTRSSSLGLLRTPKCRLSSTLNSFPQKAIKIWNLLPQTLRMPEVKEDTFKSEVKKWINTANIP